MTVGGLILVMAVAGPGPSAWYFLTPPGGPRRRWHGVVVQGLFGNTHGHAELYPAIVTLHLLGGQLLLALLVVQYERWQPRPLALSDRTRAGRWRLSAPSGSSVCWRAWVRPTMRCWPAADSRNATANGGRRTRNSTGVFRLPPTWADTTDGQLLGLPSLVAIHVVHPAGLRGDRAGPARARGAASVARAPGHRPSAGGLDQRLGGGSAGQRALERRAGLAAGRRLDAQRGRRGLGGLAPCCWRDHTGITRRALGLADAAIRTLPRILHACPRRLPNPPVQLLGVHA